MRKRFLVLGIILSMSLGVLSGCGQKFERTNTKEKVDENVEVVEESSIKEEAPISEDEVEHSNLQADIEALEEEASEFDGIKSFLSKHNFMVSYYDEYIDIDEIDDDTVKFFMKDEELTPNELVISYIDGKDATTLRDEKLFEAGPKKDDEEGFNSFEASFLGDENVTAYYIISSFDEGDIYHDRTLIIRDYKNGCLVFDFNTTTNEENGELVSDMFAEIIDSFQVVRML